MLAALGLAWGTVRLLPPRVPFGLDATMQAQYLRGLWLRTLAHAAGAAVLGLVASLWWFYLTDKARMLAFVLGLWVIYGIGVQGLWRHQGARKERETR